MTRRTSSPRWLSALAVALTACGDPWPPPPPTASVSATSAPPPPPSVASTPAPAPSASAPVAALAKCPLRPATWAGWSPDGKWLLTAGAVPDASVHDEPIRDGSVEVWNLERGARTAGFDLGYAKEPERRLVLAYSSDGKTVLIAGTEGTTNRTLVVGDLDGGTSRLLNGAIFPVSAAVSRDGKLGVVGGGAAEVVTLELPSGKELARLPYSEGHTVAASVLSADGTVVLRENSDWKLAFLEAKTLKEKHSLSALAGPDWLVPVSPGGDKVAVINDKSASIVDAVTAKKIVDLKDRPKKVDMSADLVWFAPGGHTIALLTSADEVLLWSADDGALLAKISGVKFGNGDARVVHFSPDGASFVVGRKVYDAAKGAEQRELKGSFVSWGTGHEIVEATNGTLTLTGEGGASTATWPAADLSETSTTWPSPSGALVAWVPKGETRVRVLRMSDGATMELFVTTEHTGFAVRTDRRPAAFEGVGPAESCAAAEAGPGAKPKAGLLKEFFALRPLD
ncbi:MAG: hypothetical protein U0414_09720 [Polyangiaceae bacterium]